MNPRSLPRTLQKLSTLLVLRRVNGLEWPSRCEYAKKKNLSVCVGGGGRWAAKKQITKFLMEKKMSYLAKTF